MLTYFPIFLHLENFPIRIWDESRLAINAYEMSKNGNYLVSYFEGYPDMWNTKPPLLIWLQVFFFKLVGIGELAIRLPSALAAFFTTVTLVVFSIKYLKDYWFGLIATVVLITSYGYINVHATRTGDYDALLTLFTTVYSLSFFLYTEHGNKKYLHLFFLMLVLAMMTKSIQGLIFLPALFIYLFIEKKLIVLKNKWFIIDPLLCISIVGGYYLAREYYNHGFLKAVWENELGGRYVTTIEGHKAAFMFYFNMLVDHHYSDWYWLVPCGIATGFFYKEEKIRKITLYSTLLAVSYWLVISFSKTKLEWYEVPLFPFLALIVAITIYSVFIFLRYSPHITGFFRFNIIPYVFLFIVFLFPYEKIIDKVYIPKEYDWERDFYQISYYLRDAVKLKHSVQNHYLCYEDYYAHLLFYVNILNDNNQCVSFKDWHDLQAGDMIIASQSDVQENIEENYSFEITDSFQNVKKYKIHGTKTND